MTKYQRDKIISASEIGSFVYCARAWWLYRVCGYESQNYDAFSAGLRAHDQHGRAVIRQTIMQQAGVVLLILALCLGATLLVKCFAS